MTQKALHAQLYTEEAYDSDRLLLGKYNASRTTHRSYSEVLTSVCGKWTVS